MKTLAKILFAAILSSGGWFLGDIIRASDGIVGLIAAIFSILAATLFAVITVIGDPSALPSGGKSIAWQGGQVIVAKVKLYQWLFFFYMLTLALLVAGEVIETAACEMLYWVFNVIGCLTVFCFLCSLTLSSSLTGIQKSKLDDEIARR